MIVSWYIMIYMVYHGINIYVNMEEEQICAIFITWPGLVKSAVSSIYVLRSAGCWANRPFGLFPPSCSWQVGVCGANDQALCFAYITRVGCSDI